MQSGLNNLIDKLQQRKIMVIGDLIADVYLEGRISRISREAPVLILEHAGETVVPGGAANAVYNAAALGGSVYAVGLVGDDSPGQQLKALFTNKNINIDGIISVNDRPTISKTRVMAGGQATVRQQIVRIDNESKAPISDETEKAMLDYFYKTIQHMQAVVLSDYGSGTITSVISDTVIDLCNKYGIPCMVDSRYNVMRYKNITLVKQNETEAANAVGLQELNHQALLKAGTTILENLNAEVVLITQGPDGMTLFEKNKQPIHIPVTNKSEIYDVTGAGDTVVVTMMLAIAAGASYEDAARIANYAAGIVVRKPGTATIAAKELKEAVGVYCENN